MNSKGGRRSLHRREMLQGYLSLLPIVCVLLLLRGYPLVKVILESFTNWDGLYRNDWVGMRNYLHLVTSGQFWMLIRNTGILLLNVPIQIVVGIVVAVLLYERTPGWQFFRVVFYVPQVLSAVIVGFLFRFFFSFNGPVNILLRQTGAGFMAIQWLGNAISALGVIIVLLVWVNIGWQGILFLGGLSSIDASVTDAAIMDGAGYWQRTFLIYLPMTRRILEYSLIISIVWTFTGLFPIIFSVTGGGPGYETTTIDYMVYLQAFVIGDQLGPASALAVILLVLVGTMTAIEMYVTNRLDDWS